MIGYALVTLALLVGANVGALLVTSYYVPEHEQHRLRGPLVFFNLAAVAFAATLLVFGGAA
jgi:hypothetical protein